MHGPSRIFPCSIVCFSRSAADEQVWLACACRASCFLNAVGARAQLPPHGAKCRAACNRLLIVKFIPRRMLSSSKKRNVQSRLERLSLGHAMHSVCRFDRLSFHARNIYDNTTMIAPMPAENETRDPKGCCCIARWRLSQGVSLVRQTQQGPYCCNRGTD
jgi:hypothetical protein